MRNPSNAFNLEKQQKVAAEKEKITSVEEAES